MSDEPRGLQNPLDLLAARQEAIEAIVLDMRAEQLAALPVDEAERTINLFAEEVAAWRLGASEPSYAYRLRLAVAVLVDRLRTRTARLRELRRQTPISGVVQ